jgi:hypothetical protein
MELIQQIDVGDAFQILQAIYKLGKDFYDP